MALCKRTYLRIEDEDAAKRLDKLLKFCEENGLGHVGRTERWEGEQHFIQVIVDIKISANKKVYQEQKGKIN